MIKLPKLPNIKGLATIGKGLIMAHRPELLFGASITATAASVGLAAKAGYDSGVLVERHENTNGVLLTTKEKARMTWPNYIAPAVTTVTALGSTTGLHIVHVKEKKALAQAALAAMEEIKSELKVYENELIGVVDPEKAQEVKNKVHENRADANGVSRVMNSDGVVEELYLVRDGKTGRDIWSNETRIENAMNETNRALNKNGDVELDYFYSQAGYNDIPEGVMMGWSGEPIGLNWYTEVRDDGRPIRVFDFKPDPRKGFEDAHVG